MAVYNMSKIKEWYEDFNSCKSSYINNYYQTYKSSYIVTNNDSSVSRMQKKLDGYYARLKNAYSKVGSNWKNLYNDLMNADAALAGQKSSGSVNASGASAKISSMPKLVEYKNDLGLTGAVGASAVAAGAVAGVTYTAEQVQSQAMQTATSNVQASANQVTQSVSETTNDSGGLKNTLIGAASGAAIGAAVASVVPGIGTLVGAGVGALVGTLIGSGVVSRIVEAISKGVTEIKGKVNDVVSEVKNADTVSEKLKVMGKGTVEVLKKTGATVATVGISAVEGVAKLAEDVVDLVAIVGTAITSIGTGVVDLANLAGAKITGDDSYKSDYTKRMWEGTRSFVATDYVGNTFDKFYDNTSAGKWIKENAFAFDTTRAISKEVAEVVGVVALSAVTGGGAAVMYGAAKTAEHTETNWQDQNTSTGKGLLKGVLQGVADGVFFAIGAKGDQAVKGAAEAASKTALKKAGIEVAENASKKAIQQSLKGLTKESAKALSKDLTKMLAKKTAFECGTAVAQDLGTIGIDTILSNNTVTDENGNVIELNNLSDKWNYYYNKAGGAQGLAQSAITAGVLSGMSDRVDTTGLLKGTKQAQRQANKAAIKSATATVMDKASSLGSKVKNKIDNSTIKHKVSDSVSNTKSKLHSTNLKTSYKLDQLKASANLKLANGAITVAGKATDLGLALKNFTGNTASKIKNKIDNSTIKHKVSDSVSNTKSKLHSTNLKTSYKLDQLKASANLKLANGAIAVAGKATDLGIALKTFTGNTASKIKNKIDNSTVKQKVSDSISNTKSKISTTKNVVSGIGSNLTEYSKTKLKNINIKLKNGLDNTKYKLTNGAATLGSTAINLKNKISSSAIKQKMSNSVSGIKNKLNSVKNVNTKLKNGIDKSKLKLSNKVDSMGKKAINLKNKLRDDYNDTIDKIKSDRQMKKEAKILEKRVIDNSTLNNGDYKKLKRFFTSVGNASKGTYGVAQGGIKSLCVYKINGNEYSYHKAMDIVNDAKKNGMPIPKFKKEALPEYFTLKNKLTNMGFTKQQASVILSSVDDVGACSYAAKANSIFYKFSENPKLFEQKFGFPMYKVDENGKKVLNSNELLLDMYIFANSVENGGNLIRKNGSNFELFKDSRIDVLGRRMIDTKQQVYYSTSAGSNNKLLTSYLNSKGLKFDSVNLITNKPNNVLSDQEFNNIIYSVDAAISNGKAVQLNIFSKGNEIHMNSTKPLSYYDHTTKTWNEGAGHAIFVTGRDKSGFYVSSWGQEYKIPFSDLKNGGYFNLMIDNIT